MLSLTGCTISGNSAAGGYGGDNYSGTGIGGGIDNTGKLSLANCTVSGNSVAGGSALRQLSPGVGGGVANSGKVSLTNCTVSGNSATGGSGLGSAKGGGGGIENTGTMSVADCTVSGNSATGATGLEGASIGSGGGIENAGTLSVTDSTLSSNTAMGGNDNNGIEGGISNSGTLSLTDSTLSSNAAKGGYGIHGGNGSGGGISNSGTLSVDNSTLSGNTATGGLGSIGGSAGSGIAGAIADSGTASLSFVTATDNSANSGGGIATTAGSPSSVVSIDSIYQNTQGGNLDVAAGGSFVSLGYNIFSDTPAISLAPTDLVNTDPLLGPLANNGGPTFTQALLPGSPALNAGTPVAGITTDQRGAPRPQGSAPDIGAFQVQPPLTVLSLGQHGVHGKPTALVLTFNLPLDFALAESLTNYSLVSTGPDQKEHVIPIRSARYNAASRTVTLRLKHQLPSQGTYQLTVIGTPPGGLTTTVGAYLAGAGTGQPGTDGRDPKMRSCGSTLRVFLR